MQRKIWPMSLVAASLMASTVGTFAQGYAQFGRPIYAQPRWYGAYGALNGTNHPTPHSTQGDVGPGGNNNGTLTGFPAYGLAFPPAYGPSVAPYVAQPGGYYGSYAAYGAANYPVPSSTQGDVGPLGNNNGTLTGAYRYYPAW